MDEQRQAQAPASAGQWTVGRVLAELSHLDVFDPAEMALLRAGLTSVAAWLQPRPGEPAAEPPPALCREALWQALRPRLTEPALGGAAVRCALGLGLPEADAQLAELVYDPSPAVRHPVIVWLAGRGEDRGALGAIEAELLGPRAAADAAYDLILALGRYCEQGPTRQGKRAAALLARYVRRVLGRTDIVTANLVAMAMTGLAAVGPLEERSVLEAVIRSGLGGWVRGQALGRLADLAGTAGNDRLEQALADEGLRLYAAEAVAAQARAHDRRPLVPALFLAAEGERRAAVLSALVNGLIAVEPAALVALPGEVRARLEPWTATTLRWLARGLDAEAVIARLVGGGVIGQPDPERAAELGAEWRRRPDAAGLVSALLHGQARLLIFDCEAGEQPVDHGRLICRLLRLSRPVFELEAVSQQPQPEGDAEADYQLGLVHGGRVFRFSAANRGDWYDAGAVLAALNRALEVAGRPERFVTLHSGDQSCWVTFLPAEPLRRAAAELSIPLEDDPDAARRCGLAFEKLLAEKLGRQR